MSEGSGKVVRTLKVVGVVAVLGFGTAGLSQTSLLSVKTIDVAGTSHLNSDQILDLAGLPKGKAMISVNPGAIESRIEADPWVSDASVSRKWPTTVNISVVERTAVAAAQTEDGRWAELGDGGIVLSVVDSPTQGLPVILDQKLSPNPGATLDAETARLVALVGQLPDSLRPKVIQIQRDGDGNVRLGLTSGPIIDLGQLDDKLGNKLLSAATVISKEDNDNIKVLDVRSPEFPLSTPVTTTTIAPVSTSTTTTTEP